MIYSTLSASSFSLEHISRILNPTSKSNTLHLFKVSQLLLSVMLIIKYFFPFKWVVWNIHKWFYSKNFLSPILMFQIKPSTMMHSERFANALCIQGTTSCVLSTQTTPISFVCVCVSGSTKLIFTFIRLWRQFPDIQEVVLTWWGGEGSGANSTFARWPCVNFVMPQILGLELASFWRFNYLGLLFGYPDFLRKRRLSKENNL